MRKKSVAFILSLIFAGNCFGQISLLECHDKGWPSSLDEGYTILYSLNCEVQEYLACVGNSILQPQILVAIISPDSCKPWGTPGINPLTGLSENLQNNYGQLNNTIGTCGRTRPWNFFLWQQSNPSSMTLLSNFIESTVPTGSSILMYTWIPNPILYYNGSTFSTPGSFSPWQSDILSTFQNLGFTGLDTINLSHPWIFFCKKGDLSSVQTVIGTQPDDDLNFQTLICTDEAFIFSNNTTLCEGDTAIVHGNSDLLSYQWSTGNTTSSISVAEEGYYILTGELDSTYSYADSLYHPCIYTDSIFINVVSCTGIKEIENLFSIYPNPTKENINITFKQPFSKTAQLNIYTLYGVLKESVLIPPNKNTFDISVSGFASGIYFISVKTENGITSSQKVIIF